MQTVRRLLPAAALFVLLPLTASAQLTSPSEYLGREPAADYHLTTYEEAVGYLDLLASQSPRIEVRDMGPTGMGRHQKYAVISSEANMGRLERYREISERLSLARGLDPEEAGRLAGDGKAVVWIDVGLHSTEAAPSEHALPLAWELVTGEDETSRAIRDEVITLLVFANPDGMTMVADWYLESVGTEWEGGRLPRLYNKYVGHDNNRDSYNVSQVEIRNISRLQNQQWFPSVVYNHHQPAPFPARIWVPPYGEPTNPNKPPRVIRWENLIGAAMGLAFDERNMPGVISRVSFDAWYPGFVTQVVVTHNIPSVLTETASSRLGTPVEIPPERIQQRAALPPGAFYTDPWEGGTWRMSDAVHYCLVASRAVLDVSARYRRGLLMSKYELAREAIDRHLSEAPYGWAFPPDPADPGTAAELVDKLLLMGVEVYRAPVPYRDGERTLPAGTLIVPASQPFGPFVKTLMESQDYPDLREHPRLWQGIVRPVDIETGPLRPYDVAGWTLPLQMGLDYRSLEAPFREDAQLLRLDERPAPLPSTGDGEQWVVSASAVDGFRALNRVLSGGGRGARTLSGVPTPAGVLPPGSFVLDRLDAGRMQELLAGAGARAFGVPERPPVGEVRPARIGHYLSWTASMDEGWIRWLLDEFEFPYARLTDDRLRAGDLEADFDVVILPSLGERSIVNGLREGSAPLQYTGGAGAEGVEALRDFVASGGTLVCHDRSVDFALEHFELPVEDAGRTNRQAGFYAAGSVVRMAYSSSHPLAYGMPEEGVAFVSGTRTFRLTGSPPQEEVDVVARFPEAPLLLSGYLEGDEQVAGEPMVLEAEYGEGRIVLLGFSVHNRAQARATFPLLFNALYLAER